MADQSPPTPQPQPRLRYGQPGRVAAVDRLGGPVQAELPLSDVQSSVNPPLRVRTVLLAKLVVGRRYELATTPCSQL